MNPEKFLAYAAGAGTFIAFVVSKYGQVVKANETMEESVMEVIEENLNISLKNTLNKDGKNTSMEDIVEGASKAMLAKTLHNLINEGDYGEITEEQIQ